MALADGRTRREMMNVGKMQVDRRLRTRGDLRREEGDPRISVDFLIQHGCDKAAAEHLLARAAAWSTRIQMTNAPDYRVVVKLARQMVKTRQDSGNLRERIRARVNFSAQAFDRIELKSAKSLAMIKRLKKMQTPPEGWDVVENAGQRYLRNRETGLTSWTLPRNLVPGNSVQGTRTLW